MRLPLLGFRLYKMNESFLNEMTCRVLAKPFYIYKIKILSDRILLSELALKCIVFVYKFASVYFLKMYLAYRVPTSVIC